MLDQYGRVIDYIRVSVTDRCSLRCVYCMPEEGIEQIPHREILTYDEIQRVMGICASLGIRKVKLTGGEPLVRKELNCLVKMLKETEGIDKVTLTTNGVTLKEQMKSLADAGIDGINISLDTLDYHMYARITRRDSLKEALDGLGEALRYPDISVKINCVPLAGINESQWVSLAGLAKDRKVDVRFIEMMPVGMGKWYVGRSSEEILEALTDAYGEAQPFKGTYGNGPGRYIHFQDFCGKIGFISAISHKFCSECNRIRLTSEGFLKPCLQYAEGTDIKSLLREGATDGQLKEMIEEMIRRKPKGHCFEKMDGEGLEKQEMSRIGG